MENGLQKDYCDGKFSRLTPGKIEGSLRGERIKKTLSVTSAEASSWALIR